MAQCSCRASSTRTCTSRPAVRASRPCSCATRRRPTSSCNGSPTTPASSGRATGSWTAHWDHEHWGGELPTRDWIDARDARQPGVDLSARRAHGARELAGAGARRGRRAIRRTSTAARSCATPGPADGHPEGQRDGARLCARCRRPARNSSSAQIRAAMDNVASHGVTTVHDMGEDFASMAAYRRLSEAGALKTRIYSVVPLSQWEKLRDEVAAQRSRRRVAADRRAQGFHGRLAGLAHRGLLRALHRRAGRQRVAGQRPRRHARAGLPARTRPGCT